MEVVERMILKKDLRVFLDGLFFVALASILEGLILYTLFFGSLSFLLLFSQLSIVVIGLYGMVNIAISHRQITVLPEGISVKSLFNQSFLRWTEIAEIGFVDVEWRKPKTQYIYFSKKCLPSKYRERLSSNYFLILVSGVFAALAPERLPKELDSFLPYQSRYKQCYCDGMLHHFTDETFYNMRSSILLSCTLVELDIGIQFILTGIVLLGAHDLIKINSVLSSILYLFLFLFLSLFVRASKSY